MDNTGSTLTDHDPPTGAVMAGAAALNTGGGAALIAMSSTFHVSLGAIFLASGVFLFAWLLTHRVKHEHLIERAHKAKAMLDSKDTRGGTGTV